MGTWSISHLNEAQREAVLYPNDPLLVLAGAGTGKTTAVTYGLLTLFENAASLLRRSVR